MHGSSREARAHGYIHYHERVESRKRKRDEEERPQLDTRPIHVRHETTSAVQVSTYTPVRLLRRGQVPFAFLHEGSAKSTRFLSNIACLENPIADEVLGPPLVLLAQAPAGYLTVIERVLAGEYVAINLADHITLEHISSNASVPTRAKLGIKPDTGTAWWHSSTIDSGFSRQSTASSNAPKLDIFIASAEDDSANHITPSHINDESLPTNENGLLANANSHSDPDLQRAPSNNLDEAVAMFVQQYLELLYKSRTSVAYLAKAYLPRLRASVTSHKDQGIDYFTEVVENLVLSSNLFDKKHKTIWLAHVRNMMPSEESLQPEDQNAVGPKKRRKRKLKHKPDKSGRLPGEDEHFRHWWINDADAYTTDESLEARYKRRSLDLRTREAFLQIILMLELASLRSELKPADPDTLILGQGTAQSKSKFQDYGAAVELLIDKLCIWHSVDSTIFAAAEPKGDGEPAEQVPDLLKSFCVEAVVPFYVAKTDLAKTVNKKLGGPAGPSPVSRRTDHQSSTVKASRSKKAPVRAPSDSQARLNGAVPSLARSATDSQLLPGLRRDRSLSFDPIPIQQQLKAETRKSNLMDKLKLRQREIDFDALAQVRENKRKKQAEIEDKVKEAINALKKPNRGLAGKELADVAEQRELMAQARERALKAQKARQRQQIQVGATPKHNRQRKDLVAATPQAKGSQDMSMHDSRSTGSRVPSSGVRFDRLDDPEMPDDHVEDVPDTGHRQRHQHVEATPFRSIKSVMVPGVADVAARQPLFGHVQHTTVVETPVKQTRPEAHIMGPPATSFQTSGRHSMATPSKAASPENEITQAEVPEVAETPKHERVRDQNEDNMDIYKALGWDD